MPVEERLVVIAELVALIHDRRFAELKAHLIHLDPPDLAEVILELGTEHEAVVFRLLPKALATRTFEHLPLSAQQILLHNLADRDVADILDDMNADDRTALLEELPGRIVKRLVNLLSEEKRHVATTLLGYPAESIGRLMTPDYVAVEPHWTIREALEHIRHYGQDSETLNVVYVTAEDGRLVDDLRMRELLLIEPEARVAELMDDHFVALSALDDQEEAVAAFRNFDRIALPVVDTEGILVGIVTVDDVLDVATDEATEDIQLLGGSGALREPYLEASSWTMVRKRR